MISADDFSPLNQQAHPIPPQSKYSYTLTEYATVSSTSLASTAAQSLPPSVVDGRRVNPAMKAAVAQFMESFPSMVQDSHPEAITPSHLLDWSEFVRSAGEDREIVHAARAIQALSLTMVIFAEKNMLDLKDSDVRNEYVKIIMKAYSWISVAPHASSGRIMTSE